jgi:hypothetical protein
MRRVYAGKVHLWPGKPEAGKTASSAALLRGARPPPTAGTWTAHTSPVLARPAGTPVRQAPELCPRVVRDHDAEVKLLCGNPRREPWGSARGACGVGRA